MFVHVAQAVGCNVIAVVKREAQIEAQPARWARKKWSTSSAVKDPVEAVRALSPGGRGADVVVEAVGRPEAWVWATEMVRKGGTVNFFGGCAKGSQGRTRYQPPALFGSHAEGHVPSHAGDVCARRLP